MSVLIEVLAALASIILISTVSVIVIARVVYKRIRHSRAINMGVLRTRARLTVGPQREVASLRLRLRETLASGQAAIDLAASSEGPRGELHRLFRRLQGEGTALETQLLLLESEQDPDVLASAIPLAARRVDQVAALVRRVRTAVTAGLGHLTDDTLAMLRHEVDQELAALDAGVQELHALNDSYGLLQPSAPLPTQPWSRKPMSTGRLDRGNES